MIPPSLAAWSSLLELFPEDLRPALLNLLGPLQRLLESPLAQPHHGAGEPAGYSGLSRRGIPERILLSEWLLATELPDEFLRRAATGQLAYLELDRREKQPHRSIFVLFDTGPAQAGAPRIAQLAVILVLLQRAQRAGVSLSWGILQAPEHGLSVAQPTRESILPLLSHRTWKSVDKTQWDGWKIPFDTELWLVGSSDLRQLSHRGPRLVLEDLLLPRSLDVEVEYRPEQGPPTVLKLPMPREADCMRLLTWEEPRPARKKAPPALLKAEAIQWCSNSGRLLVRAKHLLRNYSFQLDNQGTPEVVSRHTRSFPEQEQVIAADYHWGRLIAVTLEEDGTAWLYGMGRPDPGGRGPARWKLEHSGLTGASLGGDFLIAGIGNTLYFRDQKRLFRLQPGVDGVWTLAEQRRLRQLYATNMPSHAVIQLLMETPGLDPGAAEHWALYGWNKAPLGLPHEVRRDAAERFQKNGLEVRYLYEPTHQFQQMADELLLIAPGPKLISQDKEGLTILSTRKAAGDFCLGITPTNRVISWYTSDGIEIFGHNGSWRRSHHLPRQPDWGIPPQRRPIGLSCNPWGERPQAEFYFRGPDHIAMWPLRAEAPTDGFSFRHLLIQADMARVHGMLAWLDEAGNVGVSSRDIGSAVGSTAARLRGTVVEGEHVWFEGAPPEPELPLT
ncbi:MAG TPA: hypothetical protein PLA94_11190 [Myxococcota bacterium]|nr:hypothetical protein [Myxococcota bacterium]